MTDFQKRNSYKASFSCLVELDEIERYLKFDLFNSL